MEIFLVHPGRPFWRKMDDGSWSIPKGLRGANEDLVVAACREFKEETGFSIDGPLVELGSFKQTGGKTILARAVESDADPHHLRSNLFELEWPPKSGRVQRFPEVDRAAWFTSEDALRKVTKNQRPIIEKFCELIGPT